ncbi:MAG: glutaredoxin family protein [Synergistaceae bacterium]|nr:glutaredoxin family protein [Synergistaceae bacterium]
MKKIIMYSSPSCPHCHTAKDFLKKEGIPFIDKNVQNPEI